MIFRTEFVFFVLFLAGCTSDKPDKIVPEKVIKKSIYPSGDFPSVPALALPTPSEKVVSEGNTDGRVSYTSLRTIMAQNGRVLTLWALAQGSWLWAYDPPSSSGFGGVRNWNINPMSKNGTSIFKFTNAVTGTCIEAYKNGIIHNACDVNNTAQDFIILPATSGGVFLKNISQNKCLRYDIITHTIYSGIYLTDCPAKNEKSYDQIWYIAPALTNTIPLS
ncbi:hypothetical protein CYG68_19230 [Morganella morganii]|uniref:Cytolethal distending toxin subunit A n=1 Tax=Morganella morganii TaxID=582 RepID=A0A8I0U8M3_MORMO|nr:hypothetical protein [Morganella morganii]MBE8614501.1 hypothetical protein [Morganella morganii]